MALIRERKNNAGKRALPGNIGLGFRVTLLYGPGFHKGTQKQWRKKDTTAEPRFRL